MQSYSRSFRERERTPPPPKDVPLMINRLGFHHGALRSSAPGSHNSFGSGYGGRPGLSFSSDHSISSTSHLHGGLGLGLGGQVPPPPPPLSPLPSGGGPVSSSQHSAYSSDARSLHRGGDEFIPKIYNDNKRVLSISAGGGDSFFYGMSADRDTLNYHGTETSY